MTALQPAFARISDMGIRYSAVPAHTMELADALNEVLSSKWSNLRGIAIVSFGVNAMKASEEDENMIKELQRTAVLRDPGMAAATLVDAQSEAMRSAAANTSTGPMMAFAGMNMAQTAGGMNAQGLYAMSAASADNHQANGAVSSTGNTAGQNGAGAASAGWDCACGTKNSSGRFCSQCGKEKPFNPDGWTCACGALNKGKFCSECGSKKPADELLYKCDKCGWEPENPQNPPKFCPECGDPFNEGDVI
jgi:membrane protease subunit (stomatin/prohibitin family)